MDKRGQHTYELSFPHFCYCPVKCWLAEMIMTQPGSSGGDAKNASKAIGLIATWPNIVSDRIFQEGEANARQCNIHTEI